MISNLRSKASNNDISINDSKDIGIPENLESILNDFSYFSGCPCLFIDFQNNYVNSDDCMANSFFSSRIWRSEENRFADISQMKSERKDECVELIYGEYARAIFVPVKVKGLLFGYFVYGQFILDTDLNSDHKHCSTGCNVNYKDEIDLCKILPREEIEENINKSIRFARGISSQLEMSFDLKTEINKNKVVANELLLQKTFFENLFNDSPEAIVILDNKDRVIKVNSEFESLFEYTQQEAENQLINDLIVPENFKNEGKNATDNVSGGSLVDLTTLRQTKSGKQVHVQVIGKPITLGDNQVAVYAIYRNLTAQVWNQKSQQIIHRISELLNSSTDTILMIQHIAEEIEQVIGVGELFMELVRSNQKSLRVFHGKAASFEEVNFTQSLSSIVLREKKMLYLDKQQVAERVQSNCLQIEKKPLFWLGIPLIAEGKVLGTFGVASYSGSGELNLESIKLLEVIASQIAAGIIKKLKSEEIRMLHLSMEQSPASVIITDLDGNIEYVNPKFCELTGYTAEEVNGENPRILKSGFTPKETYEELWASITAGKEWKGEFLNVKKNKDLYWERANFSSIMNAEGEIVHFLAIKEDITKYKQFEKELLDAKDKAEQSDRLKSAFLANMSHELRTPLNAIIGFSNLCDDSMTMPEILEFVSLINKSGNQLLGIVEDILSFTAMESGGVKINKEEFLMANFMSEIQKLAEEKQILQSKERLDLEFNPDTNYKRILVKTDFQRLLQSVGNLLKNALKFTNDGFVEFGYKIIGEELHLYVKDSGVGIEDGKKNLIFDRFRQVDDSITRTFGGTGLGLAIVKKNIDLLGGSVEVESRPNEGSTFTIRLNCLLSAEKIKQSPTHNVPEKMENGSPLILVAEDELSNYRLIQAILKRSNYDIIRANTGEEAIQICKENKNVKLVLMDIRMPGMGGLLATSEIKNIIPDLPIIAQTAYAMNEDKETALAQGCDDYITKPINRMDLIKKLETFLR
ncbi:PAS domain S-box protein [Ancylomarina longa]|uniref:histidine kinase n=1 Tax=Ancylomarina longa TaxID=2487017 RepID=A0A434ATR9_9BACT|nr:PAS domain S-box protein [Ancylomarina longa]RUT77813.1 PAS domain S-box protein [Ancylomarina longa]